ncbi:protein kinase [Candidatus Magnetomorum sp. HK-1]|nr:protein kinase [Candidatus Magnetomorum sp. HK-1]
MCCNAIHDNHQNFCTECGSEFINYLAGYSEERSFSYQQISSFQFNNRNNHSILNENRKFDLIVDQNGNGDFMLISEAIESALPGTTIFIKEGFYNESLLIDKPDIYLIGEKNVKIFCENSNVIHCTKNSTDSIIQNISIQLKTTLNKRRNYNFLHLLFLYYKKKLCFPVIIESNVIFKNCNISNTYTEPKMYDSIGIFIKQGNPHIIKCDIIDNYLGIWCSSSALIENNNIFNNERGISAPTDSKGELTIKGNSIHNCKKSGITLGQKAIVENNNIYKNLFGIRIKRNGSSVIKNNNINDCNTGISYNNDGKGTIKNNSLFNNLEAIEVQGKCIINIHHNIIYNNKYLGIKVNDKSKVHIHHNVIMKSGKKGIIVDKTAKALIEYNFLKKT